MSTNYYWKVPPIVLPTGVVSSPLRETSTSFRTFTSRAMPRSLQYVSDPPLVDFFDQSSFPIRMTLGV